MEKFNIFFECSNEYHKILKESLMKLCSQWKCQGKGPEILRDFADFVAKNGHLSVNLRDDDIQLFLESEALPTRENIADYRSVKYDTLSTAEEEVRSGSHLRERDAFKTHIKDEREICYLALTVPNNSLGNTRFGHWYCLTKVGYRELKWKKSIRFLRHNSLHDKHGYVLKKEDKKLDVDRERLKNESGCWKCVNFIAALKFKDLLEDNDFQKWALLFPDPSDQTDHIEALTKEKISPTEFKVFRKKEHFEWYLDQELKIEKLPPQAKEIVEPFIKIIRLLGEKNIDLEQI